MDDPNGFLGAGTVIVNKKLTPAQPTAFGEDTFARQDETSGKIRRVVIGFDQMGEASSLPQRRLPARLPRRYFEDGPANLVCPSLVLVCDSISASRTKCGVDANFGPREDLFNPSGGSPFQHDGLCYTDFSFACPDTEGVFSGVVDCNKVYRKIERTYSCCDGSAGIISDSVTVDEDCVPDVQCSGSICEGGGITCDAGESYTHFFPLTGHLSDEFTTDQLKDSVTDALPTYSGTFGCEGDLDDGQGCDCIASRSLSEDETSYSIERFKYKFRFTHPSVSRSFEITWCERFIPTLSDGSPDPDEAHWTYTPKSWSYEDTGDDDSDVFERTEPDDNGTIDICCIRCCVTDPEHPDTPCEEATCP